MHRADGRRLGRLGQLPFGRVVVWRTWREDTENTARRQSFLEVSTSTSTMLICQHLIKAAVYTTVVLRPRVSTISVVNRYRGQSWAEDGGHAKVLYH